MPLRLSGTEASASLLDSLKSRIDPKNPPKLVVIQVGENPASLTYIGSKKRAAEKVGIAFEHLRFAKSDSFKRVADELKKTVDDVNVTGLILQLPLDSDVISKEETDVLLAIIPPEKDADGLDITNQGRVFAGLSSSKNWTSPIPATALGVIRLLEHNKIDPVGMNTVVIGRSRLVGMPVAALLSHLGATVTICHRQTKNFSLYTKTADLIVVAAGQRHLLKPEHIKPGVIVVDVGIHPDESAGKGVTGDVDPSCYEFTHGYSPVPGGVGPMTVACLIENVVNLGEISLEQFA